MMNEGLIRADLLVRHQLNKSAAALPAVAGVGRGILDAARGAGRVGQAAFTGAGQQARKELGGRTGQVVGRALEVAPEVALGGAALYGAERALGSPVSRYMDRKRQQLAQRLQGGQTRVHQGVYY